MTDPRTWDIDEGGVYLATFGRDEALDEGGAAAASHPGQAYFHKLQVDAQGVFSACNWRRFLVHCTLEKKSHNHDHSQCLSLTVVVVL